MTFGKEFTKAVEQKQIAQPGMERARFIVEKAEQERQANVIRTEGEAESADTIGKAIMKVGDGLVQIRKIEGMKQGDSAQNHRQSNPKCRLLAWWRTAQNGEVEARVCL